MSKKLMILVVAFFGMQLTSLIPIQRAGATLDGENGRILLIDPLNEGPFECQHSPRDGVRSAEEITLPEECELSNSVFTTDENLENDVVAAEETGALIDAATISKNNEDGEHTIVYSTEQAYCPEFDDYDYRMMDMDEYEGPTLERCDLFIEPFTSSSVLKKVNIDEDGNPVSEVEEFAELFADDENPDDRGYSRVEELSYNSEGTNVLATRQVLDLGDLDKQVGLVTAEEDMERPRPRIQVEWTIEDVDVDTGDVEVIVERRADPTVRGGYAEDGTIFYSKANQESYYINALSVEEMSEYTVDIWKVAADDGTHTQVTTTDEIHEYFLDTLPDSSTLLVCDLNSGLYHTVDVATGNVELLNDQDTVFFPLVFSPDGTQTVGQHQQPNPLDNIACERGFIVSETRSAAIADEAAVEQLIIDFNQGVALATNTGTDPSVKRNDRPSIQDWAAVVAFETPEEPEEPTITVVEPATTPVLATTGSTPVLAALAGLFIVSASLTAAVGIRKS